MYASIRLIFTCSLFALPLVACGDDGNATDANATPGTTADDTTTGTATDTPGTTTDTEATTDEPTVGEPTTTTTTATESTTEPGTTTTEPGTTTTEETATSTTDPGTSTEPDTTTTTTGDGLSWETDVFPAAIQGNCGCHQQGSGGLTITGPQDAYQNMVDVDSTQAAGFKRVAPGDSANSYLVAKLKGIAGEGPFNGNASQMPKGGAPLSDDVIALVEQWIDEGAAP